jgi:hypothetical protein
VVRFFRGLRQLIVALTKVNARYRRRAADSPLPPDRSALASTGHSLMMTDLGPLDCLGAIEEGRNYDALVPLSVVVQLDGRPLRVLGLETIVELKRKSSTPKDRLALPVLEETLKRSRG